MVLRRLNTHPKDLFLECLISVMPVQVNEPWRLSFINQWKYYKEYIFP